VLNIFTCSLIVDPTPLLLHNFASQCVIFTVCTAMNALQCRKLHTRFRKNQSTLSKFEMEHTLTTDWFFWKAWLLPLYEGTWPKNSVITLRDSKCYVTHRKSYWIFQKNKTYLFWELYKIRKNNLRKKSKKFKCYCSLYTNLCELLSSKWIFVLDLKGPLTTYPIQNTLWRPMKAGLCQPNRNGHQEVLFHLRVQS
jgi:hypothetical protein